MKIKVLRKHIKCGEKMDPASCPIALALKDLDLQNVRVHSDQITYRHNNYDDYYAETPREARIFIKKFDNGQTVKPFSFELEEKCDY